MQPLEMFLHGTGHFWSDCNGFYLVPNTSSKWPRGKNLRHFWHLLSLLDEKEHFLPASRDYLSKPNQTKIYFLVLIHCQNKNQLVKGCGTHGKVDSPQRHKKFFPCFSGADQKPTSLHPLRFIYRECVSWLSLFIHNANWHELVFSKKEHSIS